MRSYWEGQRQARSCFGAGGAKLVNDMRHACQYVVNVWSHQTDLKQDCYVRERGGRFTAILMRMDVVVIQREQSQHWQCGLLALRHC